MIRQAVILAAGRGSRMKKDQKDPYLLNTPKPLLEVGGVPIIEKTVKKLLDHSVNVGVVINPKDEPIFRKKLSNYKLEYIFEDAPLGTAHALYSARNFISDDLFLVMMGDDLTEHDTANLLDAGSPAVFGFETADVSNYGVIISDGAGNALEIAEKSKSGAGTVNTGVYLMPKEFFSLYGRIPKDENSGEYYLTHAIKLLYDQGIKLKIMRMGIWKGINTPSDLLIANTGHKPDVKIRKAEMHDLPRLIELLDQLSPMSDPEAEKKNVDVLNAMSNIISDDCYYMAVASTGGKVVATATLLIQHNLSHGGRSYGHIENVVTDAGYRGNSIGRRLVEYLIDGAKKNDCYKVILNCSKENIPFYRKCGFSENGEVEMRIDL